MSRSEENAPQMNDHTTCLRLEVLEADFKRLRQEYASLDSTLEELLKTLKKIEDRLVGSIDAERPGLITEVRQIREKMGEISGQIATCLVELSKLKTENKQAEISKDVDDLKTSVKTAWRELNVQKRYWWLAGIVIAMIAYLGDKFITWLAYTFK